MNAYPQYAFICAGNDITNTCVFVQQQIDKFQLGGKTCSNVYVIKEVELEAGVKLPLMLTFFKVKFVFKTFRFSAICSKQSTILSLIRNSKWTNLRHNKLHHVCMYVYLVNW